MRGPLIAALAALPLIAAGAPPTLESVFPPGGQQGQVVDLTLFGKFEPWPVTLWSSVEGLHFEPDPEKPGTGKLKIDPKVPEGPVHLRIHNAEGGSAPVLFIVGTRPEVLEEEKDNSTLAGAQPLDRAKLPFTLNGTLTAGGELDSYRISLEKGETLHARVEGYGLRSLIDPVLHVHDAKSHRLTLVHDSAANLDPGLAFTAPEKGEYLLSLAGFSHPPAASVAYVGSKSAHYRLSLALTPDGLPARLQPVDPGPDSSTPALAAGTPVVGTLTEKGKPRRHPFVAKKGEKWLLRVEGRSLGYPIDPVLRLLKPDGGEIRREDDTNKETDPHYLWTVAEDGEYAIEVFDRFRRSGPEMRYRLVATAAEPSFTATVDKDAYLLERGKSVSLKVTVVRTHGHEGEMLVAVEGLPAGLTTGEAVKIAAKGTEATVKIESPEDAPAFSGPLRIVLTETGEKATGKMTTAVFTFRNDNWRGPYALDTIDAIWLTLPPKKEEPKKEEAKKEEAKKEEPKKG